MAQTDDDDVALPEARDDEEHQPATPGTAPATAAPGADTAPPVTAAPQPLAVKPEAVPAPPARRRLKPLLITVGIPPTAQDIGGEADLLAAPPDPVALSATLNKWTLRMKGYLRAPIRVGLGPKHNGTEGNELHVPPRIVGLSSGTWEYVALAPNPSVSMYFTYGNPMVSANVIFSSNTMLDAGYQEIDKGGGITQAYLTLKFPDAFGEHGGLAWTVGAFSNRYGTAGPRSTSSGYYGTYLFGRTHLTGETLTANVDLSDRWQLVLEHGFGAKLEVIPFITEADDRPGGAPEADFFQGQGSVPQGSNFVHHAHAGLYFDDWLKIAGHYMTSWTPDDSSFIRGTAVEEGRLTTFGGDVHVDGERMGNGYIGYSRAVGKNLFPLNDGIQVLHGSNGRGFKENYFGRKDRITNINPTNDSGTVDSLLFQYIFRLSSVMDRPLGAREVSLALYGMFNHVRSPIEDPSAPFQVDVNRDKFKFGAEIQASILRFMSAGFRFDRVVPDLEDTSDAYTAISPRLLFYTKWKSKEYVILNYTHYYLGPRAYPGSPYSDRLEADPDMFMLAAVMSFGP